ncbi:1943_t:CDS:2, partial [Scutellospora calospora]
TDAEAQAQIARVINQWKEIDNEIINNFADYFKGAAKDMMDMNNLIESFHCKLKYTYMRG